jgi:ankyrin repeat protein
LVEAGTDVDAKALGPFRGKGPLHCAIARTHFGRQDERLQKIRLLLEKGANLNAVDDDEWTALHRLVVISRLERDFCRMFLSLNVSSNGALTLT